MAQADVPEAESMPAPEGEASYPQGAFATAYAPPAQSAIPAPIVFKRGDFSFNRRFFETKLTGFMKVIPGAAEKDMVVYIRSARGEFVGRRIVRISQTDLTLQVFHDDVTADEMIPFIEVLEVQIRHKDLA
jgi:hypothetical protein